MAVREHAVYYLEIVTSDVEGACSLYSEAYGWRFQAAAPELGDAFVATLPDGSLCGIRAPMHDDEMPIVRTYLRVTDIVTAVHEAAQLGAKIALEPTEIPGRGKIAIYQHGGVEQGLWQVP
jgi:predicted enzyme related to lactoylglutathione lyase